ncbi:MAG: hypothetical protein AABY86_01135, partial [Bdellovibrionota bacterium]
SDVTAHLKFMNYWLDSGVKKGKIEIYNDVPSGETRLDFGMVVSWDGTTTTAQTLSVNMQQNLEAGSATTWANRQFSMYMTGTLNSSTGLGSFEAAMNDAAANNRSYKFQMTRNSDHTLAFGTRYDGDGTSNSQSGTYQCVTNLKNGGNAYIVLDADSSQAGAVDGGYCTSLSISGTGVAPTEANLGVLTGNWTAGTWNLNSAEAAP